MRVIIKEDLKVYVKLDIIILTAKMLISEKRRAMKVEKVIVNEIFNEKEWVAIRITDGLELKTLRMSKIAFSTASILEGEEIYVNKDKNGNIDRVLPKHWICVKQTVPQDGKVEEPYDPKHYYV